MPPLGPDLENKIILFYSILFYSILFCNDCKTGMILSLEMMSWSSLYIPVYKK